MNLFLLFVKARRGMTTNIGAIQRGVLHFTNNSANTTLLAKPLSLFISRLIHEIKKIL